MEECTSAAKPYRSGLPIDRIHRDDIPILEKQQLINEYQSLMGGLIWLVINTRPDINVATKLLGQFSHNPSEGHLDAGKYVLHYLKRSASHGIWFKQGLNPLTGHVKFPV